jgi:tetratricopeptide (TPR) repeat protein
LVLGAGAAWAQGGPGDVASLFVQAEKGQDAHAAHLLSQALDARGYPLLASAYDAQVVKLGEKAADGPAALGHLVRLQEKLDDAYLLPSLIAGQPAALIAALPPELRARARFLQAEVQLRRGALEEARELLKSIPSGAPIGPEASYLLGVVLSDPRLKGGPDDSGALAAFDQTLKAEDGDGPQRERTRSLARLAKARTLYALERYPEAVKAYEAIDRGSPDWAAALFENGFARFRAGDPGGALGSLQALHAPQFEGSFQPESWILKATIYYFNCLFDEARTSLYAFDQAHTPMMNALAPLATQPLTVEQAYAQLARPEQSKLPKPVLLWARDNERMMRVFALVDEAKREARRLAEDGEIGGTAAEAGLRQALADNQRIVEQVAGQLAKNRILEAYRDLKAFTDQAEIIRFEATKAEKDLIEKGIDHKKVLAADRIYRPKIPGAAYDYWRFEGEYWADEIGHYRYTLKNACVGGGPAAK